MLAAFIQDFFGIAVVVISVIAYLIRLFQGNNQQLPPPVQRPGRRRDERGDDEIDSFLEQVNRTQAPGRNSGPEGARNKTAARQNQNKPPAVPPPTPAKQRQPTRQLAAGLPSAPGTRPSDAPLAAARNSTSNPGMSQRTPAQSNDKNAKEPQKDLGKTLSQQSAPLSSGTASVPTNLGSFRAAMAPPIPQSPGHQVGAPSPEAAATASFLARTNNLRQALRNPQMISQAIIVQEILSRPKSLRK
jgi:hypothetical protein